MTNRQQVPAPQPFRLTLEQQKKRARDLQRAVKAGDPAALQRLAASGVARDGTEPGELKLTTAQLCIARELGLASWPKLTVHIEAMEAARRAIAGKAAAPDADLRTLHLRCGSDIEGALKAAGFAGDFLEVSNPLCQGPVIADADWLQTRARFIAGAYGPVMELDEGAVFARLTAEETALAAAPDTYARLVLWFEHDSYDQLILLRVLAALCQARSLPVVELIALDRFPGTVRFDGLGQLPEEAIRLLWQGRLTVGPELLALGKAGWEALRAPSPEALAGLAATGTPALPMMARALRRHLAELPSTADGLSLTQRLILRLAAEKPRTIGQLFGALMRDAEPLPFLGDIMFAHEVRQLTVAENPPILLHPAIEGAPWRQSVEVTPAGLAVLAGERNALTAGLPPRWVGGVEIAAGKPVWFWDEAESRVVRG
ncbi:DUF1835 domain-containing protein [Radicibacter daui]|uniref:DUF1835 domain-containing protein n=1 Tax=Radicibacter daui TaxID=3064829 RepID=UPI004046F0D0